MCFYGILVSLIPIYYETAQKFLLAKRRQEYRREFQVSQIGGARCLHRFAAMLSRVLITPRFLFIYCFTIEEAPRWSILLISGFVVNIGSARLTENIAFFMALDSFDILGRCFKWHAKHGTAFSVA